MKISKKRMQSEYMNRLSGLHKEKKEMKANGKLEEWEEGRTWKY